MDAVGEHPVPAGPLAVRWLAYDLPELRAGTRRAARVALRNEGLAPWGAIRLAYHWLDDRGNPIVWDGWRADLGGTVEPGAEIEREVELRVPMPPGAYRLAFDLVDERRGWLSEFGNEMCSVDVTVRPRIAARRLRVEIAPGPGDVPATRAALAAQEEPLVEEHAEAVAQLAPGALPAPDWSRRILDLHEEGFAAVGGSIEGGRRAPELRPWRPTPGRNPSFPEPLLLPSLLEGLQPSEHLGLPAWNPDRSVPADLEEPWIFDGRIRVELRR